MLISVLELMKIRLLIVISGLCVWVVSVKFVIVYSMSM